MFMLFAGASSFGPVKGQGLLAGLEYLEDEPSSSEADVIGPASKRQVPDNLKITFPLMVIQEPAPTKLQTGTAKLARYIALTWERASHFSAVFDLPDRFVDSGGAL